MSLERSNNYLTDLHFLIGEWKTEGIIIGHDDVSSLRVTGTDTYVMTLEDQFILHTVSVMIDEERIEVMELIGYNALKRKYQLYSFDNKGAFTIMEGKFEQGKFIIYTDKMRALLSYDEVKPQMSADWERSEDGKLWLPWMHIKFNR